MLAMNGVRSGLVIAGLVAAGLLLTMPGAQAAPAGMGVASGSIAVYGLAPDFADRFPGSRFVSVMPRGGDGQAQAPMRHEFDWIPLLVIGGLLATGVGAYLLYSVRRPA